MRSTAISILFLSVTCTTGCGLFQKPLPSKPLFCEVQALHFSLVDVYPLDRDDFLHKIKIRMDATPIKFVGLDGEPRGYKYVDVAIHTTPLTTERKESYVRLDVRVFESITLHVNNSYQNAATIWQLTDFELRSVGEKERSRQYEVSKLSIEKKLIDTVDALVDSVIHDNAMDSCENPFSRRKSG